MKYLLKYAICVTLSNLVLVVWAENDCKFTLVEEKYDRCAKTIVRNTGNYLQPLDFVRRMCMQRVAFVACMDRFAQSCTNSGIIMTEVTEVLDWCNGTGLADWIVDDVVPTFDVVGYECLRISPSNLINCFDNATTYARNAKRYNQTLEESMVQTRMMKTSIFGCLKTTLEREFSSSRHPECMAESWQAVNNFFALTFSVGPPPFGYHLQRSDIVSLQGINQLRQLKRAMQPFPWFMRTNF